MNDGPNTNDLLVFLAVARLKSFRRAADALDRTPSALSHTIRDLERLLDVRLFNRTTRSVALTAAGDALRAKLQPAFDDIANALADLDDFRSAPSGRLRFNASHSSAGLALLPAVTRFLASNPTIDVEIVVENALVDMVSKGFDAGVRLNDAVPRDMIAIPIGPPQRSAIVASPGFFATHRRPTEPEHLRDVPCIRMRFSSGRTYAWEFERDGVAKAIEVGGPLTLGDPTLAIQAALDGVGIAFAFEAQTRDLVASGRLERVLEDWCASYTGFCLYYPSRRQLPPPLRTFVDFLKRSYSAP